MSLKKILPSAALMLMAMADGYEHNKDVVLSGDISRAYKSEKVTGFTQCQGRKHMSKKKRKQMAKKGGKK